MKKLMISAAALALTMFAAPAFADTVNLNLQAVGATQSQAGNVAQMATSVAARVGTVGNNDTVTSTAANIGLNASEDLNVEQYNGGFIDANGLLAGTMQGVNGAINQVSTSIAGTGSTGSYSSLSSTAANIGQNTSIKVNVKMQ